MVLVAWVETTRVVAPVEIMGLAIAARVTMSVTSSIKAERMAGRRHISTKIAE